MSSDRQDGRLDVEQDERTSRASDRVRLRCACGWEVMGTATDVIAATAEHGRRLHNMMASESEIRAKLEPVPD